MKWAILCFTLAALGSASAQKMQEKDLLNQIDQLGTATPQPRTSPAGKAPKPGGTPAPQQGPTEITCTKEANFDNKSRRAVFIGTVKVKDPQFTLTSDKLVAILRDNTAAAGAKKDSGLEKATADGNVIIIQDKPSEDGGPPKRYVGKAEHAEYDASTGDVTLTGWPQVQQGINNQVATEASTVMILNRDGRMKTIGGSKTVIQESADKD